MDAAAPHIVDRQAADRAVTHFNHAGASLPSAASVMAISQHLLDEMQLTPMEAGARASDRIERGYALAASLFGCSRDEIAFGTGHGQLYGDLIAAIPFKPDDRILVSRQEWVGNLIALKRRAEATGAVIEVMPSDETTAVDVKAVAAMIDRRVRLVALTWIGASGALINPAAELGKVLAGSDALYVIDASQALGQLPFDVKALGCDALIGCGRKYLRGPRGTGIAYVKSSLASRLRPGSVDDFSASWSGGQPELRAGARVLETAEFSVALRLGLIVALEGFEAAGPVHVRQRLNHIASQLRETLSAIAGVTVHDLGREMAAFVTFSIAGIDCDAAKAMLAEWGITIGKNGVAYTPIDLDQRGIPHILRASVHLDTDAGAITRLAAAITHLAVGVRPGQSDKA